VEMVCDHVQIIDKGKLVFNGGIDVLKQQRIGNKLLVGLRQSPDVAQLAAIEGVAEVEAADGLWRIRFHEGSQPHEAIVQAAVKNGWGLYHIAPDQTSLEDVFVQLTYHDSATSSDLPKAA
jgi:ABC-2 type transport system ATP-binding protein